MTAREGSFGSRARQWWRDQWATVMESFRWTSPLDYMPINWDAVEADFIARCVEQGMSRGVAQEYAAMRRGRA